MTSATTTDHSPPGTPRHAAPPSTGARWGERGSVTIWMLLWIPVLVLGLGAVVDYGAAIDTRAFASDTAFGAARAGAVHLTTLTGRGAVLDQPAAAAAAMAYVDQIEPPPRTELAATVETTATTVTVTVTATYQPRLLHGMNGTFTRTETAELQIGQ